jgi:hypothetical protein
VRGFVRVGALVAVCCGGQVGTPDATVDATAEAMPDAGPVDAQSEPPTYHIVDGGGDAPWCHTAITGHAQACCNGVFCKGFCVEGDDGGIACSCFGIPGGCNGLMTLPGSHGTVVCFIDMFADGGGCGVDNCPSTLCGAGSVCCDPDQTCDPDAGDGGACVYLN